MATLGKASENSGNFQLSFRGGNADTGSTDLDQLAQALRGWSTYFELVSSAVTHEALSVDSGREPPIYRVQVRSLRTGSIIAELAWLYEGMFTNMLWDGTKKTFAFVAAKLIKRIVTAKRRRNNFDSIKEELRSFATESGLRSVSEEQLQQFAEMLDESVREATAIAVNEVTSIDLAFEEGQPGTTITREEAVTLQAPASYSQLDSPTDPVKLDVVFHSLSRKNGWGRLTIVGPSTAASPNEQVCKVTDKSIKTPRNPYTRAFDNDGPLTVYVQERLSKSGKTRYLDVLSWDPEAFVKAKR